MILLENINIVHCLTTTQMMKSDDAVEDRALLTMGCLFTHLEYIWTVLLGNLEAMSAFHSSTHMSYATL